MNSFPKLNHPKETDKIIRFLTSTQKKTGINKVVIGLSGGIDSAVTFSLLKRAYSKNNIFALYMPYEKSFFSAFDKNLTLIKKILEKNPIPENNFYFIPLKKPSNALIDQMKTLGKKGFDRIICEIRDCFTCPNTDYINKIRVGNMMARLRMITLFDTARKIGALVCGTENKSENILGYFTRFGDAASDIEPISHLYKTQVYELAKYLKIPPDIIRAAPSANLWDDQTDEKELGFSYEEADRVLYLFHDRKKNIKEIEKSGLTNAASIINKVRQNLFKKQVPYRIT